MSTWRWQVVADPPQAIRRSIKGEKDTKINHISITPKSAIAIVPPKKVRSPGIKGPAKEAKADFTIASGHQSTLRL